MVAVVLFRDVIAESFAYILFIFIRRSLVWCVGSFKQIFLVRTHPAFTCSNSTMKAQE